LQVSFHAPPLPHQSDLIKINVTDGTEDYTIPSGSTVKFQGTKPSGLGFDEEVSYSGSVVTIVTKIIETDESGRFPVELRITDEDDIDVGVMNFHLDVEKATHTPETPDGSREFTIPELTLVLQELKAAENNAQAQIVQMGALKDAAVAAKEAAEEAKTDAQTAAAQARNVFQIAGSESLSIDPVTKKVTLHVTVSE